MSDTIIIDSSDLKKISKSLEKFPKQAKGAALSAINRTLDFTSTKTVRIMAGDYSVKQKTIKDKMEKNKASWSNLYAYIRFEGKQISLTSFKHSVKKKTKRRPGSVSVKIKRAKKTVNTSPKAFVTQVGGNKHIVHRKGSNKYPIKVLKSLSVPQMVNEKNKEDIQRAANEKLRERIDHEINWRLDKISSKGG